MAKPQLCSVSTAVTMVNPLAATTAALDAIMLPTIITTATVARKGV